MEYIGHSDLHILFDQVLGHTDSLSQNMVLFRYKEKLLHHQKNFVAVQYGLCLTQSETQKTGQVFLQLGSFLPERLLQSYHLDGVVLTILGGSGVFVSDL